MDESTYFVNKVISWSKIMAPGLDGSCYNDATNVWSTLPPEDRIAACTLLDSGFKLDQSLGRLLDKILSLRYHYGRFSHLSRTVGPRSKDLHDPVGSQRKTSCP